MNSIDIKKMTVEERLQFIEELWDSLSHEDHSLESPEWHKDILDTRKKKIKTDNAKYYTINQVKTLFRK